ncbi:MAG: cation-translocating P-type ATPase [Candidatus Azambacteria bacterium]|nr:cation-translocating P-type ATPase [Candidatus Azambacteria bacterium]
MKINFKKAKIWQWLGFDPVLLVVLVIILIVHYLIFFPSNSDDFVLTLVALIATLPVVWSAIKALKERQIGIDLLASIALVFSLLAGEYASSVFINLMLTSARMLGAYTENRSRRAIQSLLKLKPEKAKIKVDGGIVEVAIDKIKKGDLVVVELGDRIPIDGGVVEGEAEVNQSSLTGESLPIDKKIGDQVYSSTIVVSGNLIVKAEKIGEETTLEKMIQLIEEAARHKPGIITSVKVFTSWYVILMLIGSGILYFISRDLFLVLAVVLVVCADDIAIAVPLAFIASIGHAAKKGVIIKGGDFLEGINKVKILVVDKTGTLTRGKLKVENLFIFDDRESNDVLRFAGAASLFSSHPSAKAILKYVEENGIKPEQPDNFEEKSGKGAEAAYKGKKIATGKLSFLEELGIKISEHQKRDIQNEKDKGLNTTLISYDDSLIGFFTLADEIRPNVKNILSELKDLGIEKIIMLTGDNEKIAQRIAEKVGITEYHANLLPEDKLKYLEKYLNDKYKVMAIGDGVNDAALLNAADVGIAMGGIGADVTIESGDIVLMQDNLSQVPETMRLARYTARVSKQNFVIWGITNGIGLSLVFSGIIPIIILPTFAAAFNFVTDFAPILNSARLFNVHIKE